MTVKADINNSGLPLAAGDLGPGPPCPAGFNTACIGLEWVAWHGRGLNLDLIG